MVKKRTQFIEFKGLVVVKLRSINYEKVLRAFESSDKVFLSVNRKTAYYGKKRLERLTNSSIETFPTLLNGQAGYLFVKGKAQASPTHM